MLGRTLEETRVYREAKAEGREEQKAEILKAAVRRLSVAFFFQNGITSVHVIPSITPLKIFLTE